MLSRGPFPWRFTALPGEMNRYSYSGSLNTEQCLSAYGFNLHAEASSCSPLTQLNKRNMDHAGTDRHTCGETDRQTDGQIPGQMDCLDPLRAIRQIDVNGSSLHKHMSYFVLQDENIIGF